MTTITTRAGKGSPLSNAETDANFTALNAGKLECSSNLSDLTSAATARTNLGLAIGTNVQAYSADLTAIAALGNGIPARTGVGTWAARTIAALGLGLAVTNGDGVAGSPQIALANDVAAIEALSGTGFAVRTAAETWAQRTIAGTANRIDVTNGTGVSGNPTLDISASYVGQATITTVGTIATGTWSATISTTDSNFALTNSTKTAKFSAAAISAGTTRTYTLPDLTDTLVTLTATQTLTNKTLTSPAINTGVISGGTIDSATVGATTPSTGRFTTVTTTGTFELPATSGSGVGVINFNGTRYLHSYGTNNLFAGPSCGNFTMTGVRNFSLGVSALTALTTGFDNVAIGYQALLVNTTGYQNIAIGLQSLAANIGGGNNVAIGYQALYSNTTGTSNTAIGYNAMYTNTTGDQGLALGSFALRYNTSGTANVALGNGALSFNTTGSNSVAVGVGALTSAVSSGDNTAVGTNALLSTNSGTFNTGLGRDAVRNNTTGSYNVGIGARAGLGSMEPNTTGSNNTWIGYDTGCATVGVQLTNSTMIGYQAACNASNQVTLGNSSVTQIRSMTSNLCDLGTATEQFKTLYLATSLVLAATSGNVNGITLASVTTTNAPTFDFTGTDANVTGKIRTKGTGSVLVQTNSAAAVTQLEIQHTASATRYVQITGSNGGDPTIGTSGGNLILKATSASVAFGTAALATNATTGFLCVPTCAGAPTGVPASLPTGQIALVFDTTNLFLYFYTGAAWKKSTVYA